MKKKMYVSGSRRCSARPATSRICLILFIFLALSCIGCREKQVQLKVGDVAPRFSLSGLDGRKTTVPDDFRGKVVVIRFWADWCSACAREMPAVDYVYHKYRERGLVVLAVNVGQPRDVAQAFVTNLKISYPVLLDTYSLTAKKYGVPRVPFTFVLDRSGVIRSKILGETERKTFEGIIVNLL